MPHGYLSGLMTKVKSSNISQKSSLRNEKIFQKNHLLPPELQPQRPPETPQHKNNPTASRHKETAG